jgi:hypothetical protein
MSPDNVEIVRRWFTPLNAAPEGIRAGVLEFCDADVDYYPVRKFPEARPCHGREELSRFLVQFKEAFSRSDWSLRSIFEVGDDRVLACASLRAEGRGSGALHALGLEGETLEAVGLSEQDAYADS